MFYCMFYFTCDCSLGQLTRDIIIRLGVYACLCLAVYICSCCKGEMRALVSIRPDYRRLNRVGSARNTHYAQALKAVNDSVDISDTSDHVAPCHRRKSKDYRLLSLRTSLLNIRFVILYTTAFQVIRRGASSFGLGSKRACVSAYISAAVVKT